MIAATLCFPICFVILLLCYLLMPTPYRELARLGVVWTFLVSLIAALAWYEEASVWTLILLFASPVALIHVGYVVISYWYDWRGPKTPTT